MKNATPKPLKANKNFQPLPKSIGDEFYPNGIFEFNITKLLKFIKANRDIFQPEEVSVKKLKSFISNNLNEKTIQATNVNQPILLAEIAPNQFNVIDGHHRLEKAYRDKVEMILAYKVQAEQHIAFLTSATAYADYIQYWNMKIKQSKSIHALGL